MENRAAPSAQSALVLRRVLDAVRVTRDAVAVFDLDSTLFDNRPRQARILREYGAARGVPALAAVSAEHFTTGWDLGHAMRAAGLAAAQVEAIAEDVKAFWRERFFTSAYCVADVPIPGAAAFVRAVAEAGGLVAYCTGRHEPMREGSAESLRAGGFPVPGVPRVELIMKATLEETDDAFKRVAHARLRALGTVVAAFDNEPTHINDYHRVFPEALSVHLDTDHSGRPVKVEDGIPAVPDFRL